MKKNGLIFFVLSCFSILSNVYAANWRADWIGVSQENKPNSWYCYRGEVELKQGPKTAVANIACDSKYWLWVNGEMIVFEGQLKRGPNSKDTYYDEVDLAKFLKKGKNSVAVLVWYWGKDGFSHNSSGKAGLVFDARIDGKSFVSDSSWKVKVHPAYGSTDKPHPNFRLAEANIRFDAQKDIAGWFKGGFDDSGWAKAVEFGKPPAGPWGGLEKRGVLQWKNSGLIDYENVTIRPDDGNTETFIGKLPYNCHITPYLKVKAKAGQRIEIKTDNYMGGGSANVRSVYITRDGVQEYESFGWMNGHDVRYTIPDGVKVLEVKYRETGYNADFAGSFKCDDEKLNLLWEKSKRTLYVTMRDNYMDCPDRERAQWWGDMVNEMGEAFYVFDAVKGPMLAKKGIYELARWQRGDKVIYSPVPAGLPKKSGVHKRDGAWDRELPRQMLASVGWYGFWTYYWYTGDRRTIVDVYPHVRDYLSLWKIGGDGLIIHRAGDWDWTDWGTNKDVAVIENAWVYLAFKAAVEMAKLSGDEKDIAGYKAKMDSIEGNFNKAFWRGDCYRDPKYKGKTDDRAQAMAVVSGLAKQEYYPAIKGVLKTQEHASPYMEKYVLESLYMMGAEDQAIKRMKKRWEKQLDSPITTLWEGWGLGKEGFGGGTYNHAWSGGPLTILSQYGAGVAPTKPGFKEFAVLPQMGTLSNIETVVPTRYGDIDLKLNNGGKVFSIDITVPDGTTAVVGIPKAVNPKGIRFQRESAGRSDRTISRPIDSDGRWIKYELASGKWKIAALKSTYIDKKTVKKWSAPYRGWHYYPDHMVGPKPNIEGYEDVKMTDVPTVFQVPGDKKWYMTFIGFDGKGYQSFITESDDLVSWSNMRLAMGYGPKDSFDYGGVVLGAYLYEDYDIKAPRTLKKKGGKFYSLYGAYPRQGGYELRPGYEGVAQSVDGISWKRAKDEPILSVHQKDCGKWEESCIYQPWLVEYEGKYYNFYNAAGGHIEQMGMATSDDILNWKRYENNPVIPNGPKGSYNEKFSSDGKVFWDKDHWVCFFFGVGKGGAHIMAAYSRDLKNWMVDPEPLYKAGGNPSGLDKKYAHKISLVWNRANETYYMFYNAVGNKGRGIGLITSKAIGIK